MKLWGGEGSTNTVSNYMTLFYIIVPCGVMLLLMVKASIRDIELIIETQTADTLLCSNMPSRHYVKQHCGVSPTKPSSREFIAVSGAIVLKGCRSGHEKEDVLGG